MDMHRLINEVKQRPALWDASHPEHANRVETLRQWRCVADALGVKGESATTSSRAKSKANCKRRKFRSLSRSRPLFLSGAQWNCAAVSGRTCAAAIDGTSIAPSSSSNNNRLRLRISGPMRRP